MDAAFTLDHPTLSSTVLYGAVLDGTPSLGALTSTGTALNGTVLRASFDLDHFTLEAHGGDFNQPALPELTLDATALHGGIAECDESLDLPQWTVESALATGGMGVAEFSLPMFSVGGAFAANGGELRVIEDIEVSGTVLNGGVSSGHFTLDALAITADGQGDRALYGDGLTLDAWRVTGAALTGSVGAFAADLPLFTLSAVALNASAATATFELPVFTLDATGRTETVIGSGLLTLPLFSVTGELQPDLQEASTTGFALVVNTKTGAVTTYENFGFNSFAVINGTYLAAAGATLYALGSATDDGTAITAILATPISDLGTKTQKRVPEAFIGYRSGGQVELRVKTDDSDWYAYQMDETRTSGVYRNRVKIGRGLKGSYFQFEFRNVDGADFELDVIEPVVTAFKSRTA